MKLYSVDLDQMLEARERRAEIQNNMLRGAGPDQCLVCLTLNIAGDIKRTPMTKMLFDHGAAVIEAVTAAFGFGVTERRFLDEATGSEGFWLINDDGTKVKELLEVLEDISPEGRLYDFDVIVQGGAKLSRAEPRRCLICDAPAAECARSRRHGLEKVRKTTDKILTEFCARELAKEAHRSLLDELFTTPKPGLVDLVSNGAHSDMDVEIFQKSADALTGYFKDAARMGMDGCSMKELRARGRRAEKKMFAVTGGVNTHKGLIYSMGLLLAGMGRCLREGGSCIDHAASLAREDAEEQLGRACAAPDTNGGAVYKTYGARGATGEATAGFPDAVFTLSRLSYYREQGYDDSAALALCDCMAELEDTNLLHRGGEKGLEYVRETAARISGMQPDERIWELYRFDDDLIARGLSPGGSADMLALALMLERWAKISANLFTPDRNQAH